MCTKRERYFQCIIEKYSKNKYNVSLRSQIFFQKCGSQDFWRIASSVRNKVNLLYLLYSTDRKCCLLHLIKQNYLLKTFPGTQELSRNFTCFPF